MRYITKEIGVENYHPPENVYGIFANPPCTMFSRARTVAKKPRDLNEGMRLVKECLRIIWEAEAQHHLAWWALENPATGLLRNFLGKPAFEYHPYHFGDDKSKLTALWGTFKPPAPLLLTNKSNDVLGKKGWWHELKRKTMVYGEVKAKGHELETDMKSIASPHFTKAFFLANP